MSEVTVITWAKRLLTAYSKFVRALVYVMTTLAGLGVLVMMMTTCVDVVLRIFGSPLKGAYDIVSVAGAVTIACALPYTTAVKGHVAIEYFFLKLSRGGRIVVDTAARCVSMSLFGFLAWQSVLYGQSLHTNGQVTPTLQLPLFWVPYVIALSCGVVTLVILRNMLYPGREMIKP